MKAISISKKYKHLQKYKGTTALEEDIDCDATALRHAIEDFNVAQIILIKDGISQYGLKKSQKLKGLEPFEAGLMVSLLGLTNILIKYGLVKKSVPKSFLKQIFGCSTGK